ncbi:hypothetical protein EG329_002953 [Mollisiaceae sp. DMI_Dod_QoI]|nr:hypothetical protein EG329_002953 [Helotiales sp. DMI_Dod_QoI]
MDSDLEAFSHYPRKYFNIIYQNITETSKEWTFSLLNFSGYPYLNWEFSSFAAQLRAIQAKFWSQFQWLLSKSSTLEGYTE